MGQGGFGGNKPRQNQKTSSGTQGYQGGGNFWDFNPRAVAGVNPLTQGAANAVGSLPGAGGQYYNQASNLLKQLGAGGSGYLSQAVNAANRGVQMPGAFGQAGNLANQLRGVSRRQVTGENLSSDPAILAAQERFKKARLPMIQSMAAQMGLGRSNTLANAAALGQSNELLPLVQEGLAREERGIGREMGAISEQIANAMGRGSAELGNSTNNINRIVSTLGNAAGQEAGQLSGAASGLMGLGQQEATQLAQGIGSAAQLGQQLRGVEQEKLDAPYQEQQRLWAEALNSMYGPLGFLGSMGGATSTSSKK
jgi:hypothetical protein